MTPIHNITNKNKSKYNFYLITYTFSKMKKQYNLKMTDFQCKIGNQSFS